jgi:hypothetical protein
MATITPTREDLDPYFTVTWAEINPGDTCVAFDGLRAELLSVEGVGSGSNGDLMASNESTFTPINTSPNLLAISGGLILPAVSLPKARWFAPFVPSGSTLTAILLFRSGKG